MNHKNTLPVPSLEDCLKLADETSELLLKEDAIAGIPGLLDKFFSCSGVCIIADGHTMEAAGNRVQKTLEEAGIRIAGLQVFPGEPRLHAEYSHVRFLKDRITGLRDQGDLVPIAVGAGTVNDLVKRTAFELKLPYLCVPTAASVDGYTPNGAALLMDGFKQTVPCTAPLVLAADTAVIAGAPAYLSSSGFGDLASKIIAGTDWIVAEKAGALGAPEAPPIDPTAWTMIQHGLMDALHQSVDAGRGDAAAVSVLFKSLAITGFAMQYMKNSRPVSGAEHLFSHVWEMEDLSVHGVPVTHGHKVTIGTLAATAFTEIFFADPAGPPKAPASWKRPGPEERRAEVSAAFEGNRACDKITATALEKLMDGKKAEAINQAFRDDWKAIRDQVLEKLLPYGKLKELLARAGCPLVPETIGLSRAEVIVTARRAQMIRNKYSVLDLAWDMGVYETVLSTLEASGEYLR